MRKITILLVAFISVFTGIRAQTFYGLTNVGGAYNKGTLFKCTSTGTITALLSFDSINGANPYGNVIQGADGYLYGMTEKGGTSNRGTLFKCSLSGAITTLVNFNGANGANPYGSVMQAWDGNFYGMTSAGGSSNLGVLFKCTPTGTITVLVNFNGSNGSGPTGNVMQAKDSILYGMTDQGGDSAVGTLFKYSISSNLFTTLSSFAGVAYGSYPQGSLIQAFDGNLYGVTFEGGTHHGGGTLFKSTLSGTLTKLYDFDGAGIVDAGFIYGKLLQASDSTLVGLSSSGPDFTFGTLFSYVLSTNTEAINSMPGCHFGSSRPTGSLIQASDGYLYGMTTYGGATACYGNVIKSDLSRNYTTIANFNDTDGANPNGDLLQADSFSAVGYITQYSCNGNNNGSAIVIASGGSLPYTYLWSTSPAQTTQHATGLSAGTYTVIVSDSNARLTVLVKVTQLSDSMGSTWAHCNDTEGTAWVSAYGGASPYTYSWSNGATTDTIRHLSSGTYSVTITDTSGCVHTDTVFVSSMNHNINVTQTNVECHGGHDGSASVSYPPNYTYYWSPGGSTQSSISGLSAGTYTITVTNSDTLSCISTAIVTITQPTPITATICDSAAPLCNGGSNGSLTCCASGGTGPYTYLWNPSAATNATCTGLSAGCYTVTVIDKNGCTATLSTCVTQPAPVLADVHMLSAMKCNGGFACAAAFASGGTAPYTYIWSPDGGSKDSTCGLTAGNYTLTVVDKNGCTATASVTITQPPPLNVHINLLSLSSCGSCAGTTVTGGTSPYSYLWTDGATTDTLCNLYNATYTVEVIDSNGCTGTADITISPPPYLHIDTNSIPDNGSNSGAAWVTVSGGNAPYTYLWDPGGNTTDSISGEPHGSYCCLVTDAKGCTDSVCITIKSDAGINNIESGTGQISVYPNPSDGVFTFVIASEAKQSYPTIEVYNVLGEKVYSQFTTHHSLFTIDLSNQPNGIYFYRIISESGELVGEGKLILAK